MPTKRLKPQIVLRNGKPSAVILDIDYYRELLERVEDAEDLRELEEIRSHPLDLRKWDDYLRERADRV